MGVNEFTGKLLLIAWRSFFFSATDTKCLWQSHFFGLNAVSHQAMSVMVNGP